MSESIENYFLMKSVEYMIYNSNLSDNHVLLLKNIDFLLLFKNVVITFNELEIIDDDIKDNIYKILSQVRDMDNLTSDVLQNINDIIISLNIPINKANILEYYKQQLYLRTNQKRVLKYDLDTIDMFKYSLFQSICNDYVILYNHIVSDECDFIDAITDFDFNDYIASILVILEEYPQIFKSENFYQRVCISLETFAHNEKLDVKSNVKKLKKIIDKIRRK